ncbi:MAG TPA: hypothetical protein VJR46_08960 [Candidatus Dormibacteraeota bacterium]|nr:hypothetical protein [Candidatus Dormibacteraeota bacterium]
MTALAAVTLSAAPAMAGGSDWKLGSYTPSGRALSMVRRRRGQRDDGRVVVGGGCFFENGVGTSDRSGTFTLDSFAVS